MPDSQDRPASLALALGASAGTQAPAGQDLAHSPDSPLPAGVSLELLRDTDDGQRCALLLWREGEVDLRQQTATAEESLGSAWTRRSSWQYWSPLLELGEARTASRVANVILREIEPTGLERFLELLKRQMGLVAARPGCRGVFLGQELGRPAALLGITRWESIPALEAYLEWGGVQEFKPVVDPLTRATPLRFRGVPFFEGSGF